MYLRKRRSRASERGGRDSIMSIARRISGVKLHMVLRSGKEMLLFHF
jgi:hypothetical protein